MKKYLFQFIAFLLLGAVTISCGKSGSEGQETQDSTAVEEIVELTPEQKAMNSFVNTFAVLSGTMMYQFGAMAGEEEGSQEKLDAGVKEMIGKLDSVFSNLETIDATVYKTMVENPEFLKGAEIAPEGEIGMKTLTEKLSFDEIKAYIDKMISLGNSPEAETDPIMIYVKKSSEWVMALSQELNKDPNFTKLMKE